MLNPHRRAQRRVDVACGYALGSYIGVTLTWLAVMIGSGVAGFTLLLAGVAGLVGTLRTMIGMPPRFWLVPAAALVFVKLSLVCSYYGVPIVFFCAGIAYTAIFTLPIIRLFQHDFAKSVPHWLCRDCGYPLTGLPGPRCPECGAKFDPDKVPDASEQPATPIDRLQ